MKRYASESIGGNAGKVWAALCENKEQNISALEKSTGLKKEDILLSIGWLFKEGKLDSKKVGRGVVFFLN